MPSASEFSTTPASNVFIGGVNIGEGCSPGGINDVERYLAAAMRSLYDQVQALSGGMPVSGGSFTGDITRQGRGAFLHHVNSAQTNGQVSIVPEGTARPTAAEGAVVFYYS